MDFDTAEYRNQPALEQINVIPAYEKGASGDNVIVSIIDTGIDLDNPEFAGRIHPQSADLVIAGVVEPSEVRSGGPNLEDEDDHGTPIAGIIGAARDGVGIHGVAPEAQLLVFRTDDDEADEESLLGQAIAEGIERSADIGANVVNMSFGSSEAGARGEFESIFSFLKAHDIVSVIAAGNGGLADPDPSALGALDVAGAPAAIISGSVDASNIISSFTNRAGEGADIYLVAPGEFLRGVVPGGAPGETRSFSGTSASTPVISGAAALLRSLWPTLSATEIVDILLESATDLGAPGTDPIYGRGLLNIGAAVRPLGDVSVTGINGQETDVSELGADLSGVFGDALSKLEDIVVFDAYNRDFRAPLGAATRRAEPLAFNIEQRFNPFDQYRHSTIDLPNAWSMQFGLTSRSQALHSLPNNQIAFQSEANTHEDLIDDQLSLAMSGPLSAGLRVVAAHGFSPKAIDGMTIKSRNTPFLSDSAFNDAFLPQGSQALTVMTMFHPASNITIDVLITQGADFDRSKEVLFGGKHTEAKTSTIYVLRSGINLTSKNGTFLRFEQGLRREASSVFNASFGDEAGASTLYSALEGGWSPAALWRLQGRITAGLTFVDSFGFEGLVQNTPVLTTTQFSVALRRQNIFMRNDSLWLGLSQPLQIESGALQLMLPTSYDPLTDSLRFTPITASLAPAGRRLDLEMGYRLFSGASSVVDFNILHQTFSEYEVPAQTTVLIRSRFDF